MSEPRLRESSSPFMQQLLESTDDLEYSPQHRRALEEATLERLARPESSTVRRLPRIGRWVALGLAAGVSAVAAHELVTNTQEVEPPEVTSPAPEANGEQARGVRDNGEAVAEPPVRLVQESAVEPLPTKGRALVRTPTVNDPAEPDTLARELRLLNQARAALANGQLEEARRALQKHRAQFPETQLGPERTQLQQRLEQAAKRKPD